MAPPRAISEATERLREQYADAEQLASIGFRLERMESKLERLAAAVESMCSAIEDDSLNPEQAAAYVDRSAATLARWRSEGRKNAPPFERRGKAIRYRRGDLDRWMRGNREDASDAA